MCRISYESAQRARLYEKYLRILSTAGVRSVPIINEPSDVQNWDPFPLSEHQNCHNGHGQRSHEQECDNPE